MPEPKLLVATVAIATIASLSLALSTPVMMSVDGQRIVADVAPVTAAGQAYLPIRAISEASGAIASFDAATQSITVQRGADILNLKLGDRTGVLNGHRITLSKAPFSVRGRAMVPSNVVAQAFGSNVRYDEKRARVVVRTPGVVVAGAPDDSP
ncbi:MAG: hypothetical protein NVS2B17_12330 [Candidatus Velthaea sp.]